MIKNWKKAVFIFILIIIYTYIIAIDAIPNQIVIFEGESIKVNSAMGLGIKEEAVTTNTSRSKNTASKILRLNLFENIFVKDIKVSILPKTTVIPVGNIAGVKLYTDGVLVVGMSEIEGIDEKKYKPYENTGIEEGDSIISINQNTISSTDELIETVNRSEGKEIKLKYIHEEETKECSITPVKTGNNEYKLGLWVRDSAAGVGTVTYYEPSTKTFGALGHGITDIDTEKLIHIASGEFVTTKILNVIKGENGVPGKIQGTVEEQKNIGNISKNTKYGIYGTVKNLSTLNIDTSREMEVALRKEIKIGKATILCSLDNQKVEEYEIEIEKIDTQNSYNNKSMKIRVTDERLLEKTGGIIQGMSGSPIIQNGKFVGAVTHVLINNPQEGYAVFGDMMIKESKEVS